MASVPASAVKNIPAKNLRICHFSRNSVGADLLFQLLPIDRFGLTQAVGCLGSIVSLVDRPFNRQEPRVTNKARPKFAPPVALPLESLGLVLLEFLSIAFSPCVPLGI